MSDEPNPPQGGEPSRPPDPMNMGYSPMSPKRGGSTAWRGLLIGCSILIGILIVFMIIFGFMVGNLMKNPETKKALQQSMKDAQAMQSCQQNLSEISGGLERYRIAYQSYPSKLEDLYPRFLKDKSVLICPEDTNPQGNCSYTYNKPDLKSPPTTPVVVCNRHHQMGAPMTIVLQKDGSVKIK